jgi:hypothetical protein
MFSWASIRPGASEPQHFAGRRFFVLIWKGRSSEAPTEIYLPPHIDPLQAVVITEKRLYNRTLFGAVTQGINEAVFVADRSRVAGSGSVLVLWDDIDGDENDESLHYAIVVDGAGSSFSDGDLLQLQSKLNQRILVEKKSPIYLTGKMTYSGYPAE